MTDTPQTIEEMRAAVAASDLAEKNAARQLVRDAFAPLVALGVGGPGVDALLQGLKDFQPGSFALVHLDAALPNTLMATVGVLGSLHDKVKSLMALNAPIEG